MKIRASGNRRVVPGESQEKIAREGEKLVGGTSWASRKKKERWRCRLGLHRGEEEKRSGIGPRTTKSRNKEARVTAAVA